MLVDQNATSLRTIIEIFTANKQPAEGLAFNSAGLSVHYRRPSDATWQAVSLVAGSAAYTSGGFRSYGGNAYELCWPDAAIVSGQSTAVRITYDGAMTYDVIDARLPGLDLLSSLVEDDGLGTNRFTTKALEQAGGGDLLIELTEDDGSGNNRFTQKALEYSIASAITVTPPPGTQYADRQWPENEFSGIVPTTYYYADQWTIIFPDIPSGIPNGEKIVFALKDSADLDMIPDDNSVLEVTLTVGSTTGLTRINGSAGTASDASMVYEVDPDNATKMRVVVTVEDDATSQIAAGIYNRGLKVVGESSVLVQDRMTVVAPVTQAFE